MPMTCGNHGEEAVDVSEMDHYTRDIESTHSFDTLWAGDTKYVELVIVNDYARFLDAGSVAAAENEATTLINIVDSRYRNAAFEPSNVRVVLKYQVTMSTGDPWTAKSCSSNSAEVDFEDLLIDFLSFVENHLHTDSSLSFDNAQLLSGLDFCSSTVGYAYLSSMCYKPASGGINQVSQVNQQTANIVAHEIGHNFNMQHDGGSSNNCDASKFVMASTGCLSCNSFATEFSSCSKEYLSKMMTNRPLKCLSNAPSEIYGTPVCGDGFVEQGEECDCGSSDCSLLDPCCDGSSCMLKETAECSETDACCNSCRIRSASEGFVCRKAFDSTCDVPEVCNGVGSACPVDIFKEAPGFSCTSDEGFEGQCYEGGCLSVEKQCNGLFVPTLGDCPFSGCSAPLKCRFQGTCLFFNADVSDGTPCPGGQCFKGICSSSALLFHFFDNKCSLSCDSNQIVEETVCRRWDGVEVDVSECVNAYPIESTGCSTFAPLICEINVTFSNSPLTPGDHLDIDWNIKGTADFLTLVLDDTAFDWAKYINFSVDSEIGTYRYTIEQDDPTGTLSVRIIASSSVSNISESFNVQNNCTSVVNCDLIGGICVSGTCVCNDGYSGAECSETDCSSIGLDCANGSVCDPETRSCTCSSGFSGFSCQIETSCGIECEESKEEPNPGCSQCECIGGYTGSPCECTRSCENGVSDDLCLSCLCDPFYTGDSCEFAFASLDFTFTGISETSITNNANKNRFSALLSSELAYITTYPLHRIVIDPKSITFVSGTVTTKGRLISTNSSSADLEAKVELIRSQVEDAASVRFRAEVLVFVDSFSAEGNFGEEDDGLFGRFLAWLTDNLLFIIPAIVVVGLLLLYKCCFDRADKQANILAGTDGQIEPLLGVKSSGINPRKESKRDKTERRKKEFKQGKRGYFSTKKRVYDDSDVYEDLRSDFGIVRHKGGEGPLNVLRGFGMEDLPPNWTVQYYDDGDVFFFNTATDAVSKDRPV